MQMNMMMCLMHSFPLLTRLRFFCLKRMSFSKKQRQYSKIQPIALRKGTGMRMTP